MSENSSRSENESSPSSEYLRKEIEKIKAELNQLKNLKDGSFGTSKSTSKRKTAAKRKPVKRRAVVKRKTAAKRKPVKRRAVVKRRVIRRK